MAKESGKESQKETSAGPPARSFMFMHALFHFCGLNLLD